MRAPLVTVVASLLLAVSAAAHQAPVAGFGTPSPDAPPETAQFAFLVGEWSCTTRNLAPGGKLRPGPDATWTGYYILDGWAIQDDWVSTGRDGKPFHGTNIRSFNPETGRWDNRWLPSGTLRWKHYEAEKVGETMVMTGGEGVDGKGRVYVDRNTFYGITDEAWRWRKDRSFDGKKSWIGGVALIDCRAASEGSASR